ncbi:hypothetical protein ALC57_00421 [Trachymyrmex cornetzi]|uniref:Uncharacterized protein n=1 Tax=Trachymyrmex cornetzi TaxID=471704 RepID=A0A151JRT9_9HYME|nr:hypothetical protein ALC57_00421 [Trachymyrmex cornetzi]
MSGLYIVTPRAPTQSNKNLVSSTSAPAHPIPAVNTLACPLPDIYHLYCINIKEQWVELTFPIAFHISFRKKGSQFYGGVQG